MSQERLMTSWSEYDSAIAELLPVARHSIVIFDRDLAALKLELPARHDVLASFLRQPGATLRVAVQSAQPVQQHCPRLIALLRLFAHSFHLVEVPPHLAHLGDAMFIVDGTSAVVRFHGDHARSKQIQDDAEACKPYCKRFDEIWAEGGTPISATTLGL